MDEQAQATTEIPAWFWIGAGLALVWEAIGGFMYISQVTADPATLPLDQRAMIEAAPMWMTAAFAVSVWSGLAGAALLLMRRKLAVPLLLVSLVAVAIQFSALLLVPALRDRTQSDAYLLPIIILVAGYAIFMLARIA
ncbi:MAG: hypothetical protein ABIR25_04710, partial [Sphingomicrobium sp.]